MKFLFSLLTVLFLLSPSAILANTESVGETFKGEVLDIIKEETENDFIKGIPVFVQTLEVQNIKSKEIVNVKNDFRKVDVGQKIFYSVNNLGGGEFQNYLVGVSKIKEIIYILLFFVLVVVIFSGKKGIRSLLSLFLSLLVIIFVLLPLILKGYNPLIIGPLVSFAILSFAIFFSYGVNKISKIAFIGTSVTVIITSIFAFLAIKMFAMSGLTDETYLYLSVLSENPINLVNLLTAGIIIGVLGVLDDIAITQVAVVRELYLSNSNITNKEVYKRAINVGRDHVSALVNTLVLAYVGVAMPLILLFKLSNGNFESIISQEMFASEIIRTIVGSVGVILAVPITTILAVKILGSKKENLSDIKFNNDIGHSHHHEHGHHH